MYLTHIQFCNIVHPNGLGQSSYEVKVNQAKILKCVAQALCAPETTQYEQGGRSIYFFFFIILVLHPNRCDLMKSKFSG